MQRPDDKRRDKEDWNWTSYFNAKKQKLESQFRQNRDEYGVDNDLNEQSRNLFKGVGIFVNGYTNPTEIELKAIMLKHGGCFYDYICDRVTHYIASNLAHSKALILKDKMVIKPEWILDCIKEKRILDTQPYVLVTSAHDRAQNKLTGYLKNNLNENSPSVIQSKKPKAQQLNIRKSIVTIDLRDDFESKDQRTRINEADRQKEAYLKDCYDKFKIRIEKFELTDKINRNQIRSELEIEKIKDMLDDWIFWTSRLANNSEMVIDPDEIDLFKNYLLYLLNYLNDLEKLSVIMKLFKRLIEKNGNFEWTAYYKDILASIQTHFYEKFNYTIRFN